MTGILRIFLAAVGMIMALTARGASAHESLPIVISFNEAAPGSFTARTRIPGNISQGQAPLLSTDRPCVVEKRTPAAMLLSCPRGDRPQSLSIMWPDGPPASAILVRAQFLDGSSHAEVHQPGTTAIALPEARSPFEVAISYVRMGAEHIALGIDHLLFLALLIIVSGTARRTVKTVTGFTIGHAVTITLASLGIVGFTPALVEALIALSIVFVAVELIRSRRDTLFLRYPAIMSAGFGTLHGLGFASALAEIGLATNAVVPSLIGFNLGVEFGQLAFVVLAFASVRFVRRSSRNLSLQGWPVVGRYSSSVTASGLKALIVMTIGALAAFWFWERSFTLFA